jgi:hypothetical protein
MPDGLLLAAFALTLVVNAVLIVVAIRAMQPGGALSDQPRRRADESSVGQTDPEPRAHGAIVGPATVARAAEGPPAETPSESVAPGAPVAPVAPGAAVAPPGEPVKRRGRTATRPADQDGPPTSPARNRAARQSRPATAAEVAPAQPAAAKRTTRSSKAPAPGGNGRRRRFSLPPLDEDGEKVSRSIETFLSGGESTPDPAANDADDDTDVPTTVALVAITDAAPPSSSRESPSRNGHEPPHPDQDASVDRAESAPPATNDALAAVERSLRSAARGTDRVDVQQAGRFRVVLASAGELAARAYLRRVRATVEPLLDELDPPRRLAVATATVLDDPLERAEELAERRLATAIEADDRDHRVRDEERVEKPRASGD